MNDLDLTWFCTEVVRCCRDFYSNAENKERFEKWKEEQAEQNCEHTNKRLIVGQDK